MTNRLHVNNDGFCWLIVTDKADEVFDTELCDLYKLYPDDTEALIETKDELLEAINQGFKIGIEVGHLKTQTDDNRRKIY